MTVLGSAQPTHQAIVSKPANLTAEDVPLFEKVLSLTIQESFVYKLEHARIYKDILSEQSKPLPGLSNIELKNQWIHTIRQFARPYVKYEKGVWIGTRYGTAYFHWLTEALPRLEASLPYLNAHPVILPSSYQKIAFITETLSYFPVQVVYYNETAIPTISELIVAGPIAGTGHFNDDLMKALRTRFTAKYTDPPTRKIYVSRQKAARRKVLNEESVVALVTAFGYEIHCLEDYTTDQKVQLLATCKSLIGIHGAGLTNMLLMREPGKILEFRKAGDDHNNSFLTLSSALDHAYYYLTAKGDRSDTHSTNLHVDLDKLENVLKQME